jgi:hypothetical protein
MVRAVALAMALVAAGWASSAQAQVKLAYKFPEGSKTTDEATVKVHQILTLNGMDLETEATSVVTSSTKAGKRKSDGNVPVEKTLDAMKNELTLPGGVNITFDSSEADKKEDNPQLAIFRDLFKAVVGMSYTIVLDKDNKVVAVEGTEKIREKVEAINPQAAAMMKEQIDADYLKKDFEQDLKQLPTILVRKGEPWDRTETDSLGGGQSLTYQKRYEYKGTVQKDGKTLDKIDVTAKSVKFDFAEDSPLPAKVTKSDLKVDTSEGTILFDREAGRAVERTWKVRLKGDMTLSINGQDLPAKLDLTMENNSKLKNPAK